MARSTGSTTAGQKSTRSPGAPPLRRLSQWGLLPASQPWLVYLLAFLASALAALLRWGLGAWVGPTLSPFATFYPLILFVALLGGTGPGLLATVLSMLAVDFFFLLPRGFEVAIPADQLGLAIFFGTNIAVSFVCGALRSARHRFYAEARRAQASEERFRLFMDHTPTLVWIKDDQGRYVYLNQAYRHRFGLSFAQCQGKTDAQLWPPAVAARLQAADRAALASSQPIEVTEDTTELDGTRSSWLNTKFPYRDAAGHQFVASIGLDITPHRRAEEALLHEKQFSDYAINSLPGIFYLFDAQNRPRRWNRNFELISGYCPEEIARLTALDFIAPEDRPATAEAIARVLATGEAASIELHLLTRTGRKLPFAFSGQRLEVEGQPGFLGVGLDISERQRTEEALRESEQRFRILFETSPLSTFLIDPDTQRILDCNQQAGDALGYTCEQLCQLRIPDIEAHLASEQIAGVVSQVAQGRQLSFETRHRTRSGEIRDVLVTARLLQLQGRQVHYATAIDITARKHSEKALRQSEAKFRLLFAHAPDAIFLTIPEGRITAANPAACTLFGMSEAELTQAGRAGLIDPTDPRHALALEERRRTGKFCRELNYLRKNGESFTAETHSVLLGGEPLRSFVMLRDITQRKRFEEALQDSEARLRLAVQTAELGMYERDLVTNALVMNSTCQAILGVADRPFPPDVARRSVHPEDQGRVFEAVARAFDPALRDICAAEFRILRPDGTLRWVAGRGRVIFDDTASPPRPLRFLGVLNDITQRKVAEHLLQRRNEHLQILHHVAARLLAGQQPVELLARLHPQLAQTFGVDVFMLYQPEEGSHYLRLRAWAGLSQAEQFQLQRLRYGRAICARPAEAFQPILATHIQTREAPNRRFVRKLGFRSYLYYPLILNHRLQGTLAFASRHLEDYDPTDLEFFHTLAGTLAEALERQRLESELQRHAAHLDRLVRERTAKLEETIAELEGFSYSLVHDLRAPLRALHSYTFILQAEAGARLHPDHLALLGHIQSAALRMDQLVTDALNYSKILRQDLPLGPVNLGPLLRDMVETYPSLHPTQSDVAIEIDDLFVHANQAALTQIFSNLLDNAVKFVAPGVHPRVRIWAEPLNPAPTPASQVLVWVEDNGIGIPKEAHETIFGMFQRLHPVEDYSGTGIGLTIVRKSLERIGGQISLDSAPGKGSRFCVLLSLARPPAAAPTT